ncbi:hypothetical protein FRC07_009371 [Ceratobasidium sp. 392]|nr:hypothetical protein FRC07_009371 [Ceratobasidium sp. 392]
MAQHDAPYIKLESPVPLNQPLATVDLPPQQRSSANPMTAQAHPAPVSVPLAADPDTIVSSAVGTGSQPTASDAQAALLHRESVSNTLMRSFLGLKNVLSK